MNRFEYVEARLHDDETFVSRDQNVKIYDGDQKTEYEEGEVVLTTHRLFWGRPGEIARAAITLCLSLRHVISLSEETASSYFFGRKTRYILHLREPPPDKAPGPIDYSPHGHIKLSGKNGLASEFGSALRQTIEARIWEVIVIPRPLSQADSSQAAGGVGSPAQLRLKMRTGIGGIERSIEAKAKETDENIALAFQDLSILMAMAKDMVAISKVISTKIREQKGEISDDETEQGGMMSLADVYCRVNRARGLELLSPEDLLHACQQLNGPIKLRKFPSGAMVLQLESQDDELVAADTLEKVKTATSLAVEELAKQLDISLLLAKERLVAAERLGKVCRDESVEGLRFYPNLLLYRDIDS